MARRWTPPVVAGMVVAFALAPATAHAELTDTFYFSHDDTLETQSSLINSGLVVTPADAQPDDQRLAVPNELEAEDDNDNFTPPPVDELREAFRFEVGEDEDNGSFTAQLNWANPTIDFDMYIYRERPNGTLDPTPVAQSATGNDEETATYISPVIDSTVEAGAYVVYVDNWCSSEEDPIINEAREYLGAPPTAVICGVDDEGIDEDDFSGKVEFAPLVTQNKLPTATISGPGRPRPATASRSAPRARTPTERSPATRSTSTATATSSTTPRRASRSAGSTTSPASTTSASACSTTAAASATPTAGSR